MDTSRRTAFSDEPVTVFLIGMRINSLHRVDRWGPVFTAFPKMLSALAGDPDVGMLGSELWLGRTTISLQYWTSPESLRAFAADPSGPHLAPWRRFRELGRQGHVGIWHETYVVEPAGQESVYLNMPTFGLGAAVGTRAVGPGLQTARQRLTATGTTATQPDSPA